MCLVLELLNKNCGAVFWLLLVLLVMWDRLLLVGSVLFLIFDWNVFYF